jgi:c-di-GMP-binding flagellar brake protein YcgR
MRLKRAREQPNGATVQRREYVRVSRARPATIRREQGRATVSTYSIDLSGLGILLAGPETLALGERVKFRLSLADEQTPIVGEAIVARLDSRGYRAIRIDRISEGDHRRLVRYVFERQREERRRDSESELGDAG